MTFPIPNAALSQHIAILGKTGSGKTSTEKLTVEHVVAEGFRVCVLDAIKSDWWGITSSASGKREGLPFKILGGPRGHVPLHSSAGKVIGQLVGSGKLPLSIIDMADFEPGGLQRFFVEFAPALLRHARGVVYLVIEEAHEFAPKERSGIGAENMAIHWAKKLATAGRSKGIRMIVATQRVQALHNAVLGSCETMIAHRLTTPADQEPVIKWLKANVDKETLEKVSGSLSSLPTGTGWICSGEAKISEMVRFPKFKTYDNTATPTGDGAEIDVKTAAVDHDELRTIIGDAVKEAEANDPRLLKAEIAQLRRQVQEASAGAVRQGPDPKAIEAADRAGYERGEAETAPIWFRRGVEAAIDGIKDYAKAFDMPGFINKQLETWKGIGALRPPPAPRRTPVTLQIAQAVARTQRAMARPPTNGHTGDGAKLAKAERLALTALAQYPQGRSKNQVAILTGYAVNGGGFNNALSSLRSQGFITGRGDSLEITQEGMDMLGPYDPLPSGPALLDHWMRQLGKAEREALRALVEAWPDAMAKEEIAASAGYAPDGGGFNNALSRLRTLELVSGRGKLKASDDLFGAGHG